MKNGNQWIAPQCQIALFRIHLAGRMNWIPTSSVARSNAFCMHGPGFFDVPDVFFGVAPRIVQ